MLGKSHVQWTLVFYELQDGTDAKLEQTHNRQYFHTDASDLVGLLCMAKVFQLCWDAQVGSLTPMKPNGQSNKPRE